MEEETGQVGMELPTREEVDEILAELPERNKQLLEIYIGMLEAKAATDPLTKVHNRDGLLKEAERLAKNPRLKQVAVVMDGLTEENRRVMERYHLMLEDRARFDPMLERYEIYNRRGLLGKVHELAERAKRGELKQVAVVILDIDSFKQVNDGLGHVKGDRLLAAVAKGLKGGDMLAVNDDVISRYGGDEFVMVLPVFSDQDGFKTGSLTKKLEQISARVETERLKMEDELPDDEDWPKAKNGNGPAGRVSLGGKVFGAGDFLEIVNSDRDVLDRLLEEPDKRLYGVKATKV